MSLSEYITTLGDAVAAKRLGISERAARSYRTQWRRPRPEVAQKIIKRSKGALTMESIYG